MLLESTRKTHSPRKRCNLGAERKVQVHKDVARLSLSMLAKILQLIMSEEEMLMFLMLRACSLTGHVAAHGDEFSLADEVEGRAV